MRSNAERQAAFRARNRKAGNKRLTLWIPAELEPLILKYIQAVIKTSGRA